MSPLLADLLPDTDDPTADDLLGRFLDYVAGRELTAEDHQRLNGYVEQILQKGSYTHEELLREVIQQMKQGK